jgi:hypothetical protein
VDPPAPAHRDDEPHRGERQRREQRDREADPHAEHDVGDEQHDGDHRDGRAHQAAQREPVGHVDHVVLLAHPEQDAVQRRGRDEQHGGRGRADQRGEVGGALEAGDLVEARRERHREQEREEDLHAGLDDAHLLEQLDEVAVQPLGVRLVAVRERTGAHGPQPRSTFDPGTMSSRPSGQRTHALWPPS